MSTRVRARPKALRLPVPDLHKTLQKYLRSVVPLLQDQEARGGPAFDVAYNERVRWADEFEHGLGAVCQQRLYELDKASPHNWLDDNIWLKKAYHEWRAPLLVNSNWWLAFYNDTSVPSHALTSPKPVGVAGITPWQVRRASWLVNRTLEFKDKLEQQELYPETTRTGTWFRENALRTFNICRVPQANCDFLSSHPPPSSPDARKIVVMIRDWFYAIDAYHPDGIILSSNELEKRIRRVVRDVETRMRAGEAAIPVGILSADERDHWAKNLEHLLSLSPSNHKTYTTIQQSLFALSLDHYTLNPTLSPPPPLPSTPTSSPSNSSKLSPQPSPHTPLPIDSPSEIDSHLHNIRSSLNAHNRFFDKAYTLIVESNSRAGAMGEHSPCDALVPSVVAEYAIVQGIESEAYDSPDPEAGFAHGIEDVNKVNGKGEGWERLEWVADEYIAKECVEAEKRAQEIIADSDDSVLWFAEYGADWMKSIARLSPDAYIQMALQLTWYKSRGTFTATYETVLTRLFDRGRTETIRTLTADSRAWVLAMDNESSSLRERFALLRRAIQTHTSITREGATGKGIDRHLLGLRLMMRPDEGEKSDLFEDEVFGESQTWKLSTSGLSAGHLFRGTGFGAAYNDGYGINYLSGPDIIKFGIESKYSCPLTSTAAFQEAIVAAMRDMKLVCTEGLTLADVDASVGGASGASASPQAPMARL